MPTLPLWTQRLRTLSSLLLLTRSIALTNKVITDDPNATCIITIVVDNGIRFDDVVNIAK
jgi:hypothetical protein